MSSDDEKILRELGRAVHAQERTHEQEQLDKLSAEQLSPQEIADLAEKARGDADLARAIRAYEPLAADIKAQITARVLATARARPPDAGDAAAEDEELGGEGVSAPVSLAAQRARRRRVLWGAMPLAAAAAVALLWAGRSAKPIVALPEYTAQITGGEATVRSAPAVQNAITEEELPPVRVGGYSRLRITLRPTTTVGGGSIDARVYLIVPGGVQPWPGDTVQADSGAVQLVLAPPPTVVGSASAAVIVIARTAVLAKRGDELLRVPFARGPGYQRWRLPLLPSELPP